jgi:hypothetical protein
VRSVVGHRDNAAHAPENTPHRSGSLCRLEPGALQGDASNPQRRTAHRRPRGCQAGAHQCQSAPSDDRHPSVEQRCGSATDVRRIPVASTVAVLHPLRRRGRVDSTDWLRHERGLRHRMECSASGESSGSARSSSVAKSIHGTVARRSGTRDATRILPAGRRFGGQFHETWGAIPAATRSRPTRISVPTLLPASLILALRLKYAGGLTHSSAPSSANPHRPSGKI